MRIKITVFKKSGKYYTEEVVESDKELRLFENEFQVFVYENLPALITDGYVVVNNDDCEDDNFYESLYKFMDLHNIAVNSGAQSLLDNTTSK